jgi:hypothetical protein
MCNDCIPKIDKSAFPKFKMTKEQRAALPGKDIRKKISEMTPQEHEEHLIFRRAYERIYRDWNRTESGYLLEYQKQYQINYQKNHAEELTEYIKSYMAKNPDWILRSINRRKQRLSLVPSEPYTIKDIIDKWGTICYLCQEEIDPNNRRSFNDRAPGWEQSFNPDHVIPISAGGSDTLDNVRPTHAICNIKKGSSIPEGLLTDEHRALKVLIDSSIGQVKRGRPLKDG